MTRLRESLRRLALALAVTGLALIGGEIAVRLMGPDSPSVAAREREEFLRRLPGQGGGDERASEPDSFVYSAYGAGFQLHPFFGFTARRGELGVNNQGFVSWGREFPYRKRDAGELVIGLFGGSVAGQLSGAEQRLLTRLEPTLKEQGYDKATLLTFAIGGWRQPQSFFALIYFLSTIDVAVVLDGFNEVVHLSDGRLESYPAAFPWSDVFATLARGPSSPEEALRVAELVAANRTAARVTRTFSATPLRQSLLAHLAWRAYAALYTSRVEALREAGRVAREADWSRVDPPRDGSLAAKRDDYLGFYGDLVRFSALAAREKGKLFFHFVQPNQYLRGSKPLTAEEQTQRISNTGWFDVVTPGYQRLEALSGELRAEGIQDHFLGHLFSDTRETVYSDDCCHLNQRGVEMLADEIATRILDSGQLAYLGKRR